MFRLPQHVDDMSDIVLKDQVCQRRSGLVDTCWERSSYGDTRLKFSQERGVSCSPPRRAACETLTAIGSYDNNLYVSLRVTRTLTIIFGQDV